MARFCCFVHSSPAQLNEFLSGNRKAGASSTHQACAACLIPSYDFLLCSLEKLCPPAGGWRLFTAFTVAQHLLSTAFTVAQHLEYDKIVRTRLPLLFFIHGRRLSNALPGRELDPSSSGVLIQVGCSRICGVRLLDYQLPANLATTHELHTSPTQKVA